MGGHCDRAEHYIFMILLLTRFITVLMTYLQYTKGNAYFI